MQKLIFDDELMNTGRDARLMVPRLLDVIEGSGAARDAFAPGWPAVPLPALLPWASSMLSLLGGNAGDVLLPMLQVMRCIVKDHLAAFE